MASPILWPECQRLLENNQDFVLMEDGAPAHNSFYTNCERVTRGVRKVAWPPSSPDFNPIEHIWDRFRKRLQRRRRGSNRITSITAMKEALLEAWEKLTIEEINHEISRLPNIMEKCIIAEGKNNYHA